MEAPSTPEPEPSKHPQNASNSGYITPGASRPPTAEGHSSTTRRRQMFTPSPSFNQRSRPASRYSSSRPSTSLSVRKPGDVLQGQPAEAVQTFLRVRPPSSTDAEGEEEEKGENTSRYLRVLSRTEIMLTPPEDDVKTRNRAREQFSFTRVFPFKAEQEHIFQNTTLPLVKDLVRRGRDALVFAYGMTNSGKTYTVQGSKLDPGILPRSLHAIFTTIQDRLTDFPIRPLRFCEVELRKNLTEDGIKELLDVAAARDKANRPKRTTRGAPPLSVATLAKEVTDASLLESGSLQVDDRYQYSIWISFAEIYSEKAYDLLCTNVETGTKASTTAKRKHLIITHCPITNTKYMHGLREVQVRSVEEAFAVLELGQRNRTVFSNQFNQASSRSHSIFTVKLLKIPNDVTKDTLAQRLGEVAMCRMSVVDLAGQERAKGANSTSQRLREAGNINQSLMVLGQCMEAIRINQANPSRPVLIPYRHSKLTELFQGFFFGEGRASMIINVNPFDSTYHETSHIIRFASNAREVTMYKNDLSHRRRRLPGVEADDDYEYISTMDNFNEQDEYIESLLEQITELRQKWMEAEDRLSRREDELREEMEAEMAKRAQQMEEDFEKRLQEQLALSDKKHQKPEMTDQSDQTDFNLHEMCNAEIERLKLELAAQLALLAERDARLSELQAELDSVRLELTEVQERRKEAEEMVKALGEQLKEERELTAWLRKEAEERGVAHASELKALRDELEEEKEMIMQAEEAAGEQKAAVMAQMDVLRDELRLEQEQAEEAKIAANEQNDELVGQLVMANADLERSRDETETIRTSLQTEVERVQELLEKLKVSQAETSAERERCESVVQQLETLQLELQRERALSEEGRLGEAAETARVQQLLKELEEAQAQTHNERSRADTLADNESAANTRIRELLEALEKAQAETLAERERYESTLKLLESLKLDLQQERTTLESTRRDQSSESSRIQKLTKELEESREEAQNERLKLDELIKKDALATARIAELTAEIEALRGSLSSQAEERARIASELAAAEERVRLITIERDTVRKEMIEVKRSLEAERLRSQELENINRQAEIVHQRDLDKLQALLRELERVCRETKKVKLEREVALEEVEILRERLNRDRNQLRVLRHEMMRVDHDVDAFQATMTKESMALELQRIIHASEVERDDFENRLNECETASARDKMERLELIEKNQHMKRVLAKLAADLTQSERESGSRSSTLDEANHKRLASVDLFLRTIFKRRSHVSDVEIIEISKNSPRSDKELTPSHHEDSISVENSGASLHEKEVRPTEQVDSTSLGTDTARPHSPTSIKRRLSKMVPWRIRRNSDIVSTPNSSAESQDGYSSDTSRIGKRLIWNLKRSRNKRKTNSTVVGDTEEATAGGDTSRTTFEATSAEEIQLLETEEKVQPLGNLQHSAMATEIALGTFANKRDIGLAH